MTDTILHCIPGMGGGGAERQLAYLAGPLRERGWDVHVALVSGGPNLERLQKSGAAIHRLRAGSSYDPRLAWQIQRLIRQIRPDIVQTWFVQMEVIAGLASSFGRVPWILSERSSRLAYPRTWKNRLRVRVGRRASAIVANSAGGEAYWAASVGRHVHLCVIPNGVPIAEIETTVPMLPPGVQADSGDAVVLIVGRIDREKNVERVFEACRDVVQRSRAIVVFCGDGPLRAAILDRISRDGLTGRVFAPGYVEDIWPVMKRADVIVAANTFEGRPNTVVEAMAAERPLVVSDIPAHREILSDDSALWADPQDPAAIAAAIRQVLKDPALGAQRARLARRQVGEWSIAATAAAYDRLYRDVLTRVPRR